jgi:glutamate 5-kinase
MKKRQKLTAARRWVVKIGSALLTNNGVGLNVNAINQWVQQIAHLREQGMEILLVSSGSVAEGMSRLGWRQRPKELYALQAAAAVGQMGLVQTYESAFSQYGLHTAQILLTHDDLSNRQRYLNARSTLRNLLSLGVIPVINENDTVVTDEIRFGDNDTLAALVANLIEADHLVILTDQDGLYESDPRENTDAKLIHEAEVSDPLLDTMAKSTGGVLGKGGMATKLAAARLAARSATSTVIAPGLKTDVLLHLRGAEQVGSLLYANNVSANARKQWLAGHLQMQGQIHIDPGAVKVLTSAGKSLLPVGITAVDGAFKRGEMVACIDAHGKEIARGLVNYSAKEINLIKGQSSEQIEAILGYVDDLEVIHRDNLVLC